ncbi:hypothetical protein [Zobellia uliginosa]|uniref:hypothetical protein n=1 Tax=Zobellia uliginosa TaxID=143224 RepID=UPI001C07EBC0|nr:hypothetical protein [Zobellia uliginosa]MBU2946301.1 hypothetical protein [Zobellia uliginosa]
MKMLIKKKVAPTIYQCTTVNRTVIGAKKIEFVLDKVIEVSLDKSEADHKIFTIKLLGHKLIGTSLIHEWTGDMEELQNKLVLKTDVNGAIIGIQNRNDLYIKWHSGFMAKMLQKYKKRGGDGTKLMVDLTTKLISNEKALLKSLDGFNLYHIFFQGNYEKKLSTGGSEYKIKGHFGKIDLPLNLQTEISKSKIEGQSFTTIDTQGFLNKDKFKQEAFTKYIKGMIGVLDVDATLHVEMEEKYTYNNMGWITEADLYLKTHAANMYALANAHIVKQISKEESELVLQSFAKTEQLTH